MKITEAIIHKHGINPEEYKKIINLIKKQKLNHQNILLKKILI